MNLQRNWPILPHTIEIPDLLKNGNDISRARMLEYLHGRPISESISELLSLLVDDSNPLVAQAASSLISDSKSLEGGI